MNFDSLEGGNINSTTVCAKGLNYLYLMKVLQTKAIAL